MQGEAPSSAKSRPSAKRSRDALPKRDDAMEDDQVEEYDSDEMVEAAGSMTPSSAKKQRGRQTSHAIKVAQDDTMFRNCFADIKELALTQMATKNDSGLEKKIDAMMDLATKFFSQPPPAPAPAPAPDPGIAALLQMAGMFFQNQNK